MKADCSLGKVHDHPLTRRRHTLRVIRQVPTARIEHVAYYTVGVTLGLSARGLGLDGLRAPLHDGRAPGEAAAERGQQHQVVGLEPSLGLGHRQRDRQRRGRRVGEPVDVVDDAIGRESEALADRADDPRVGLVVDEQLDVLEARSRTRRAPRWSPPTSHATAARNDS